MVERPRYCAYSYIEVGGGFNFDVELVSLPIRDIYSLLRRISRSKAYDTHVQMDYLQGKRSQRRERPCLLSPP